MLLAVAGVAVCAGALYGYMAARRERTFRTAHRPRRRRAGERRHVFRDRELQRRHRAQERCDARVSEARPGLPPPAASGSTAARSLTSQAKMDPAADAALRDLRRAAEIDPLAPRPLELLGDVNYSLLRYDRAAEEYQKYIDLDDRSPRILYKLALSHYSARRPDAPSSRFRRPSRSTIGLRKRITCWVSVIATRRTRRGAPRAEDSVRPLRRRWCTRARSSPISTDEMGQTDRIGSAARGACGPSIRGRAARWRSDLPTSAPANSIARSRRSGSAAEQFPDHPYTYVALGRVWLEKAQPRPIVSI